ncbi:MAG: aminoglycoside phosphotransferase family protein [Pseudomonadota bacterium]
MFKIEALRSVLEQQASDYVDLEIYEASGLSGTDNDIYRLGTGYCLRIPKSQNSADQLKKEVAWLPVVQKLPLAVPQPVILGQPTIEIAFDWAIYTWLDGQDLLRSGLVSEDTIAKQLSQFLKSLWALNIEGGPRAGRQNNYRGGDLCGRDTLTREAFRELSGEFSENSLSEIWSDACDAATVDISPRWVHGDIHAANMIVDKHRLIGLIDWGLMGVGDPAVDLMPAWSMLSYGARSEFKRDIEVDEVTWRRGRGWAVSVSVIAYAYYKDRPDFWLNEISKRTLNEILADTVTF